jgi:hypothetical protein
VTRVQRTPQDSLFQSAPSNCYQRFSASLKFLNLLPILLVMSVNLISSNHASQANEAAKPAAPKPQQTQQKTSAQPSDTVTLKSTGGDANHDGDSH